MKWYVPVIQIMTYLFQLAWISIKTMIRSILNQNISALCFNPLIENSNAAERIYSCKKYTTSGYNIVLVMFPDGLCAPKEEM